MKKIYVEGEEKILRLLTTLETSGMSEGRITGALIEAYPEAQESIRLLLQRRDSGRTDNDDIVSFSAPVTALLASGIRLTSEETLRRALEIAETAAAIECHISSDSVNLVLFLFTFSAFLEGGRPALRTWQEIGQYFFLDEVIDDVANRVRAGDSFSEATRHHHQFTEGYVYDFLDVGEHSGALSTVCREYAEILAANLKGVQTAEDYGDVVRSVLWATLAEAGLPFLRICKIMSKHTSTFLGPEALIENQGYTISEAMKTAKAAPFTDWAIALIEEGERTGRVAEQFRIIANHYKWDVLGIKPRQTPITQTEEPMALV